MYLQQHALLRCLVYSLLHLLVHDGCHTDKI
jgi:hypothetical protein